jgi:alpha-L-fucosidase
MKIQQFLTISDIEYISKEHPTLIVFNHGVDKLSFRLRHSTWRLKNKTKGETISQGTTKSFIKDACTIFQMFDILEKEGIFIEVQL